MTTALIALGAALAGGTIGAFAMALAAAAGADDRAEHPAPNPSHQPRTSGQPDPAQTPPRPDTCEHLIV